MIAQVDIPSEGLSSGYFSPLILAALLYAAAYVTANVLDGRGDERSETARDAGFIVMLLAGVYVLILFFVAVASEFDLIWDMVLILVVVAAFFGVLVLVLLAVFEWGIGGISRARRRVDSS